MSKLIKTIHLREYIIASVIAIAGIILGTIFDLNISKSVYDPVNTSMYGVIGSGFTEIGVIYCLFFGGFGLIVSRLNKTKVASIICIILGIAAIAIGIYFFVHYFNMMADFEVMKEHKTLILVLSIVTTVIFLGAVGCFVIFSKFDKQRLFAISMTLIITAAIVALVGTALKYVISRPRPYYILDGHLDEFRNWYEFNWFASIKLGDEFKSCPSGHSIYGTTIVIALPLMFKLSPKFDNKKYVGVIAFYVGLMVAICGAVSRIFAGAHFLSDISIGVLVSLLLTILSTFLVDTFAPKLEKFRK